MTDRPCSACVYSGKLDLIDKGWLICTGSQAARASGHGVCVVEAEDTCPDWEERVDDVVVMEPTCGGSTGEG